MTTITKKPVTLITKLENVEGHEQVTNILITRYETSLYSQKEATEAKIKDCDSKIRAAEKALLKDAHDTVNSKLPLNIPGLPEIKVIKIKSSQVNYDDKNVSIDIMIGTADRYGECMICKRLLNQNDSQFQEIEKLQEDRKELVSEMCKIITEIGSLSRKERQLRGIIAERKLRESGIMDIEEFLNDKQFVEVLSLK